MSAFSKRRSGWACSGGQWLEGECGRESEGESMKLLDDLGPIDWSDFEESARLTQAVMREIVAHPTMLRELLYSVEDKPELLAKCERLALDDKIVLYDALERGFRLRLHISKNEHREVPHDHRFSITVFILRGTYYHKLYVTDQDQKEDLTVSDLHPVLIRDERAGACYTMHHSAIESNTTAPGTMSLLLRGPTAKDRAIGVERATGRVFWKYGERDEPRSRREQVQMSLEDYRSLRARVDSALGWTEGRQAVV
jgi:hypothetical protein